MYIHMYMISEGCDVEAELLDFLVTGAPGFCAVAIVVYVFFP